MNLTLFQRAMRASEAQRDRLPHPSDDLRDLGITPEDYSELIRPLCRRHAMNTMRRQRQSPPDDEVAILSSYLQAAFMSGVRTGMSFQRLKEQMPDAAA